MRRGGSSSYQTVRLLASPMCLFAWIDRKRHVGTPGHLSRWYHASAVFCVFNSTASAAASVPLNLRFAGQLIFMIPRPSYRKAHFLSVCDSPDELFARLKRHIAFLRFHDIPCVCCSRCGSCYCRCAKAEYRDLHLHCWTRVSVTAYGSGTLAEWISGASTVRVSTPPSPFSPIL